MGLRIIVLPLWKTPRIRDPLRARIPNDFVTYGEKYQAPYVLGMTLGGLVFGAIYVAG